MNSVPVSVGVPIPAPLPAGVPAAAPDADVPGLPAPSTTAVAPSDLLGMIMALMQGMSQQSIEASSDRIAATQTKLSEAVAELSEKLQEAARKAAEAAKKDDDGGFFGAVCDFFDAVTDFVANAVGEVLGTVGDFSVDLVMAPFDIVAGMIQGRSLNEMLMQVGQNLGENGAVADTLKGCTKGVTKFLMDVAQFSVSYLAVIEAGLRGENPLAAMKEQVSALKDSFMNNLVRNPDVMEVAGWVLKGLAVATAIGSGGALAWASVGLLVLSELNKRYDIADKAFGHDVGKFVTLGLELSSSAMLILSSGGLEQLKDLASNVDVAGLANGIKAGTLILEGAIIAGAAIDRYINANAKADDLDRQAEIQSTMNRVARMQRLMEALIDELGEKIDGHQRQLKAATKIYQLEGASYEAAVFRA